MYWQAWSSELKEVLELKGSPVAITYSPEPAANPTQQKRLWACRAFQLARDGEVINLSRETSACPGGTSHLGLGQTPPEHLDTIADFLVNGEKLMASRAVFYRSRSHESPPLGLGKYVVLSPLEKAELEPDLVMFLCSPLHAMRLVMLVNFEIGDAMDVRLSGSTCRSAVSTPLVTGRFNLSLIDTTSRHMCKYDPNELIATVPFHLMHGVMRSLDRCSAGRAPVEWPEKMKALMREQ